VIININQLEMFRLLSSLLKIYPPFNHLKINICINIIYIAKKLNNNIHVYKLIIQHIIYINIHYIENLIVCTKPVVRDDNGAGRGQVSLSHTHPCKKNASPSPYLNPTGIKLLSHPHPHQVTGIISYPYPYPFS